MYSTLLESLNTDTLILTVTRRLATFLTNQTENPNILPITQWFENCWHEYLNNEPSEKRILLSSNHELALWQQLIRKSAVGSRLLQLATTAHMSQQAWQLAKQWCLDLDSLMFTQTEDTLTWQAWAREFIEICSQQNWMDNNSLPDCLSGLFSQKKLLLPKKIILIGFTELNPQYQNLFDTLTQLSCAHELFTPTIANTNIKCFAFADSADEIEYMARWAKQQYQASPDTLIGCIVPNLSEIRDDIVNTFTEVFVPTAHLPGSSHTLPFNISASIPLSRYPIIHTALTLLDLSDEVEFSTLSLLLRSAYLGYAEQEMCLRARLDLILRQQSERQINIRQVVVAAQKIHCDKLAELLQKHLANLPKKSSHLKPSEWATLFKKFLTAFGWPGERSLDSAEYQLVERWNELLDEFSRFDIVLSTISFNVAFQHLYQLAIATLFQPQSLATSIQILSPTEASGLIFDQLWVMGLHDGAWPPAPNPNPFLPMTLQRQFKLPHASSEQELRFYMQLTLQLSRSAPQLMLSYPKHDDDRALRPTPLITASTVYDTVELNLPFYQVFADKIRESGELESYNDLYAPSLIEAEKIGGGNSIFKHQASCPFRAFAQLRLGAQPLITPEDGLNARERGILLHRTLEVVWNKLSDQATLLSTPDEELAKIIDQAINIALLEFIKQKPLTFKERFTWIEKTRLQKILNNWLALEKQRPPFSVLAIEQAKTICIAGIPINIRVDRIDQLADGRYLIIDYKTNANSINNWLTDRPDDPQLPLYACTSTLPIQGLAFAKVHSKNVQFRGISADDINITGIKPIHETKDYMAYNSWQELVGYWRNVLSQLAEEFRNGYAAANPKKANQTCQRCDLPTLCRIAELSQSQVALALNETD